jgi:proline iminopeptidase
MIKLPLLLSLFLALPAFAGTDVELVKPSIPEDRYTPGRDLVTDFDRIVTPHGVQESFIATLGGTRQYVSVRGADRGNPILLYIHGGPASVELPISWSFQRPW